MKKPTEENLDEVKKDNPEQSRRFVDAAKQLDVDETGESFDIAIDALSCPNRRGKRGGTPS